MTGKRIPAADEVRDYLNERRALGLGGASVRLIASGNHLIYRVDRGGRVCALRMINPTSYRRREWISMADEYAILRAITPTKLGPKAYAYAGSFDPPFLVQEFITATCFNDLKPLREEHLTAAARAIAALNTCDLDPRQLLMERHVRRGYRGSALSWWYRLGYAILRSRRADIIRWAARIAPLAHQTALVLARFEPELPREFTFHFDAAHTGNTYWQNGQVLFLDWQKVSWRNDPSFTLVRFATSVDGEGWVPEEVFQRLVRTYLDIRPIPNFERIARMRLLERQVADLVWVLYDCARRGGQRSVEEETRVISRYHTAQSLLRIRQRGG